MPYPTPPPAPDSPIADLRGSMVEEVAIPILNAAGHDGMSGEFANAYRHYNRSTVTMSEVADSNIERLSNAVQDYVQGTRDYVNAITSDYMTKSQMESLRNKIDDLKAYLASPGDGERTMSTESSTWGIESVSGSVSNSNESKVESGLEDVAEMDRIYTYRLRERDRLQDDYYALIERLETRLDNDIVTNREASEGTPRGSILRAASAGDGVTGRFQESDYAVLPSDIGGLPTIRGTDASYADVSTGKADPNRGTGEKDAADTESKEDEKKKEEEQAAPPTQTSPPTGTPGNSGTQSPGGAPSAPSGNRGSSPSAGPSRTPSSSSGERSSTSSDTGTSNSSTGTTGPSADQIVNDLQNASAPEQVQAPAPNTMTSPGYMPYMPPAMGPMNPTGGMPSGTPGSGATGSQTTAPGSTLTGQQFNDLLDSIPQQAKDTISQNIPQRPADVSSGINDAINRTRDAATQVSNAAGLNPATNPGLSNPSSAGTAGSGATAGSPKVMGAQPMAGAPGNAVGGRGGMGMPMMPPPMMGAPGGGGGGRGNDGRKIVSNDPDMLGKDIKSTDPVVNARQRIADNEANK